MKRNATSAELLACRSTVGGGERSPGRLERVCAIHDACEPRRHHAQQRTDAGDEEHRRDGKLDDMRDQRDARVVDGRRRRLNFDHFAKSLNR